MQYKTATNSRIRLSGATEAPKQQANSTTHNTKGNTTMSTKAQTSYHRAIN